MSKSFSKELHSTVGSVALLASSFSHIESFCTDNKHVYTHMCVSTHTHTDRQSGRGRIALVTSKDTMDFFQPPVGW